MASRELKRTIANEVALGHTCAEVAKRHNYSYAGMRKLLDTTEVKSLVEDHQRELLEGATRVMFRYLADLDTLSSNMLALAHNVDHPKSFEANKWIQERILPSRSTGHANVDVNLTVRNEVLTSVQQSLNQMTRLYETTPVVDVTVSPHLRDGRDAVPTHTQEPTDGIPVR